MRASRSGTSKIKEGTGINHSVGSENNTLGHGGGLYSLNQALTENNTTS